MRAVLAMLIVMLPALSGCGHKAMEGLPPVDRWDLATVPGAPGVTGLVEEPRYPNGYVRSRRRFERRRLGRAATLRPAAVVALTHTHGLGSSSRVAAFTLLSENYPPCPVWNYVGGVL